MDDLNRERDDASPITPQQAPTRELFFDSFTAPSRPIVTEQRLMVDVVSKTVESPLDQSRNDFILVSPGEVASRFVLRLSPPHNRQQEQGSDSTDAPLSAFETTMDNRDTYFSGAPIISYQETRTISSARDEEHAHNISIDDRESTFAPIQDTDDASFDDQSESDQLSLPNVGLKFRKHHGDFSGDDMTW